MKDKEKYSLVIGRFQPLHEGHCSLIQTLIDENKKVCVAIMDTNLDEENPYTIEQRKNMFCKAFGDKIKITVIPPINEMCYGRHVGYNICRVVHNKEYLSATAIRENMIQEDREDYYNREFINAYKCIAKRQYEIIKEHGFFDEDIIHPAILIAKAHSELSEALECFRLGDKVDKNIKDMKGSEVQLSDCLGILMGMEIGLGLQISKALLHKQKYNRTREYRHGGKEF